MAKITWAQLPMINLRALKLDYVILLSRRNVLRQIVSEVVRRKDKEDGKHAHALASRPMTKVNLTDDLKHAIYSYEDALDLLTQRVKDYNTFHLTYETLTEDQDVATDMLLDHLQVNRMSLFYNVVKRNPYELGDMIQNWDEVQAQLKDSAWEWMLYE